MINESKLQNESEKSTQSNESTVQTMLVADSAPYICRGLN